MQDYWGIAGSKRCLHAASMNNGKCSKNLISKGNNLFIREKAITAYCGILVGGIIYEAFILLPF